MLFDFNRFQGFLRRAYAGAHTSYSLEEVSDVFLQYFTAYEKKTGHAHPPIKTDQIRRIIERMDSWDDELSRTQDVIPSTYEYLIPQHFKTKYRRCDFNINHFFSGRIREMRYYDSLREPADDETLYQITGIRRDGCSETPER